eukprot:symbB.v1.2.032618.t1/scaffold3937.1/size47920/2
MAFAGGKVRSSSHSGSSASGSKGRPRSTASSASRGLARRIQPERIERIASGAASPASAAGSALPAAAAAPGRAASPGPDGEFRSRSPEASGASAQDLTERLVTQIMSRRLVQDSDMEDLRLNVMSILQPALKKSSLDEVQRLSLEVKEARSRTAHARSEIARLKQEAMMLEQKSTDAEEKSRRAETRASKAEARLKSSLQEPIVLKFGSETVEVGSTSSRARDTEGSPGAQSPGQRRSLLSGQLHSGTSPEPSEAEVGDEASHRSQRLLDKQRKKEEADAARRAAEERMKDQRKKKQEEKGTKEQLSAMKEMGEELKKAKADAKEAEMQISQLRIKLEQAEATAKMAEKSKAAAEKKLKTTEQELNSLREDPVFEQVNMLRDASKDLQNEVEDLQQQLTEKEDLLQAALEAKALAEEEQKPSSVPTAAADDKSPSQEAKRLKEELEAARSEAKRLHAEVDAMKSGGSSEEVRKLREELEQAQSEVNRLRSAAMAGLPEDQAKEAKLLQEELEAARSEAKRLHAEVDAMKSGGSSEEVRKLREEIHRLKSQGKVTLVEVAQAPQEDAMEAEVVSASKPEEAKVTESAQIEEEMEAADPELDAAKEAELALKRAEREKQEALQEAENSKALQAEQHQAELDKAKKNQEAAAKQQAEEHEKEKKNMEEAEAKRKAEAKKKFEDEKAKIKEAETEKNQKKARDIAEQMEREYFENLLGGVWEAWEHAYRQSSAERKKAEAKAEIERLRKEELLKGEVSKAQIADQMYKQYCQELLDGVWELWRDIFKAERAEKAQEAAKLKMEQEMHRFKQAENDRAFNTAKQIAEQMYIKYCNGLFEEIVDSWKEEVMSNKKEKLFKKQQAEEEGRQKAQQEKDLREADVLAQKMYKTHCQDDVKFCLDVWIAEHKAALDARKDEEAKKKHEAELAALRRLEQETGERAALQIAQKMFQKIVDDNKKFLLDSWQRIAKQQRSEKADAETKRKHQEELDRIKREELEKKDNAAQALAEKMFRKYWDDNMSTIVEYWRRCAAATKDEQVRKKHEEELAKLKRNQEETGTKAAVEISKRMYKAYCDSLQKLTLSSWHVWSHQSRSGRKEEEAKKKYEEEMAKIKRLEMEKANKAASIAGMNMYKKVLWDNTSLLLTAWKDITKDELLSRKIEKDMRDHKNVVDNMKKEAVRKHEQIRDLVAANMFNKDKKEIQSDAFAKWVISWRQTLIERQQHAETCQLKDQMEKLRRAEDEKKQKMKHLMASQFSITGNRAWLHICVNNWRLVWEATKVEKQQAQAVQELTGKLRQMDKDTNEFVNRTKDKLGKAFYGRQRLDLLSTVVSAWRADTKEEILLRRKDELASSYEKDIKLLQKRQKEIDAAASDKKAKAAVSQLLGATLSVCWIQWKNFTKECLQERREAELRQQLQEELKQQKREAEKLNDTKSRQIAMNMVSFERNSVLSVCLVAWRQAAQVSIKEAEEALAKQKMQEDFNQFKSKADKQMLATRDRMAMQLLGREKGQLLGAMLALWRSATKEEKMAREQAERERLNKVELARVDGLRREAAKDKAFRTAARFFENHNKGMVLEIFLHFRKCVELSVKERKVEEAKMIHEEEVKKMERLHGDRRAKFISTTVQGKERILLFNSVKQCLSAWSQLVFQSRQELVRAEQEEKLKEELNNMRSALKNHSKKNAIYASMGNEQANHQFLLQRLFGVWKEYRAEQGVQRFYEDKIAQLMTQFEDDAAELMHAQGMKIYKLKMALAENKAKCERRLVFQYCLQKWDDCKYQRQLQDELRQVNERHEDELAELVHAQGLTKHRLHQRNQERFLKGVIRQELQRHFLAWSHLKRLNLSTAAELLAVAKAKQQLEKETEIRKLKAFRVKDRVVFYTSKNVTLVRIKDMWLAWWQQVCVRRFEIQQEKVEVLHKKELENIRKEAQDEQQALGDRMHYELEQVGRETYLRDLFLQWHSVAKKMRSHRSYRGEMDQIRKEAQDEVTKKEEKTVEQLLSFANHSAELLIKRRAKEPVMMIFMNWRMVQEREKYAEFVTTTNNEVQELKNKQEETLKTKEEQKEAAFWKLATFSYLVREKFTIRLFIFHSWREACMWSRKAHTLHVRTQNEKVAAHSKEVVLLTSRMLVHSRDQAWLTKVMCQWLQVVERSANEKSLELKDEENVQKVEKSILQERVAGSKRAQVLIKWLFSVEFQIVAKWMKAWMAEVRYAKIVRALEAEQQAHQETIAEHGEMMEKHQDALVPYFLRLKKQLAMARYFSAFAFLPFINRSENHLQQTIQKLDKKRDRHVEDVYKLRRKTVAETGEVLNFFRGQRELQMLASLVFVVWSEFATERMSSRRWNEQREVKLKLENELKVLHDQTWHLRIDTKKGKDLTDTCRHMAGWTGDLLMEISMLHAWGWWKLWHVQEKHGPQSWT